MAIVDALMAMTVLSTVMLGLTYATVAGQQHLHDSDIALRGLRLSEHLMEEIISRPYHGSNHASRATFHLDDYGDHFAEQPDDVTDFTGEAYGPAEQQFSRSVSVTDATEVIPALAGINIPGKQVTITTEHVTGKKWTLTRFIPEPDSP